MQSKSNANLSAIVLAGGQSSRMGQDKALIAIGQRTLLQQVCEVAQHCADVVYVVTPWIDRYQPLLGESWESASSHRSENSTKIRFIQEHPLSQDDIMHGPLVGFAQGLVHVETEWTLLLACDLPNLRVEVLQSWLMMLPNVDAQTIALLCKNSNGWWEALCGFYRRRSLEKLKPFIEQGGRSFQRWLDQELVQELPISQPDILFNCNTPADVEQARKLAR
ncbi:molybdenum cofactor guanylyltransferase [Thermocoleostomius sinensis]|jgi:molybdopterin-guanine dinucleotide biosynthesis protein A|uniref:Probable molybdenum cofactor guanylyltransferase n=1 Tax=Thermocoleostomius sinensis A174 TaxID=2016057 RepID=A0A9E8ZEX2_9CYAN|nr:molybdenum cofactor guanylyltransferase [Thermocoleostomius sinensis]WAL62110.1 molybdenum cofactor guanylyltransferase [Thermocoleostomius sinensis A174]